MVASGSPPALPLVSAAYGGVIASSDEHVGLDTAPVVALVAGGAAAAAPKVRKRKQPAAVAVATVVGSAAPAARKAPGKRQRPNITTVEKTACHTAFRAAFPEEGSRPAKCPDAVRVQLCRDHGLTDDQIAHQYSMYTAAQRAAVHPAPSSVDAAASAFAATVPAATLNTTEQREAVLRVFEANVHLWGNSLPAATYVNGTEVSKPLMDLMHATGLSRSKLKDRYKKFLADKHAVLSTSLDERRAEILGRLKLDDKSLEIMEKAEPKQTPHVLKHALELAGEHPICANTSAKVCVEKVRNGRCRASCLARLKELAEVVAMHTVASFNEVRPSETSLGFAIIASNNAWVHDKKKSEEWMIALGEEGEEVEERPVIFARCVITESLYDALRTELHETRNPVKPFPAPVDVDISDRRAPVLYYIAGWLLHCIRKDLSAKAVWRIWLTTNQVLGAKAATELGLPHELVTKRSKGGLLYASWRFFHFVWYLEQCYVSSLTMEALCVYGKDALGQVHSRLLSDKHLQRMFQKTFSPTYLESARELLGRAGQTDDGLTATLDQQHCDLLTVLLGMYMRMRGRDAVAKLTAQARLASSGVNSLRSKLAACATAAADKMKAVPPAADKAKAVPAATVALDEFPAPDYEGICDAIYAMLGQETADALLDGRCSWPVFHDQIDVVADDPQPASSEDLMSLIESDAD